MSDQINTGLLPELQQVEAIIQQDNKRYLSTEILGQIPLKDKVLPIHALSLGSTAINAPCITFVGGVHGFERIGTQVVLTFLETLLNRLQWDLNFEDLLQRVRIIFLPLINPVGMINATRANGNGVDIMRNAPVDCLEEAIWLGGGHRISNKLPWYRGKPGDTMESEAQILSDFIKKQVLPAPFSLVLDCHSGFGFHNQIWFPYAKSRLEPIKHLGEIYYLRQLFFKTYPYQNYKFEPNHNITLPMVICGIIYTNSH